MPSEKPIKVILDSSFLFIPSKFNFDIFKELEDIFNRRFEPIILSVTYAELKRINKSSHPKMRKQAAFALELARRCHTMEVDKKIGEAHDSVIVRVAAERGYCVATNDRLLKRRLRTINVPVVYMRQKKRLALDGIFY